MGKIVSVLLATYKMHPFCNFLHRNAWVLCANALYIFRELHYCSHHTKVLRSIQNDKMSFSGRALPGHAGELKGSPGLLSRVWWKSWE